MTIKDKYIRKISLYRYMAITNKILGDDIHKKWNDISNGRRYIREISTTVDKMSEIGQELYHEALYMRHKASPIVTEHIDDIRFGAVILTKGNEKFCGANVEEWGMTLTRHAEMVAIDQMRLAGNAGLDGFMGNTRSKDDIIIDTLMVVGVPESIGKDRPIFPCALCLNYISQFCTSDTMIIAGDLNGNVRITTISELLPEQAF